MSTKIDTVLITGASSGIGLDVAKAFLQKGSNVVLNSSNEEKLKKATEGIGNASKIALVPGDVGNKETGIEMVKTAIERFGGVNVLVNSAGIFAPKPFLECTEEDLDKYFRINLKGTYFTSQAAVPQMKKQGGGSIINVGTVLVNHSMTAVPDTATLVSKGGVHSFTVNLAAEVAKDNIRVNAVAPGIIRTPIHGDMDVDSLASIHPLNRIGEVKDTTDAILYLATQISTFVPFAILITNCRPKRLAIQKGKRQAIVAAMTV